MKVNGKDVIIGVICFLIVFMVTAQIRTINRSESDILKLKTENELRDEINQWKETYDTAVERINELNAKINEYQKLASQEDETAKLIKNELDEANLLVGRVDVKGPGVKITLDDTKALAKIALDAGFYDPNVYIIHDSDLLMIVNVLRSANAEAISINGQRIIANTEIVCTGPQVQINGIKTVAPFEIYAIGDSETLRGSLNLRGGIIDTLKASNIDVTIEKQDEVLIPAYTKTITYQYAEEVVKGDVQ